MTTRRRFITLFPLLSLPASAALVSACGEKTSSAPAIAPVSDAAMGALRSAEEASKAATKAAGTVRDSADGTAPPASAAGVDEKDAVAVSLGYVAQSSRVDQTKYASHQPSQACGNCALFGGKPSDVSGPCPMFGGKQVASTGWCSAYSKRG